MGRPRPSTMLQAAAYVIVAAVGLPVLWLAFAEHDPNRWLVAGLFLIVVALSVLHHRRAFPTGPLFTHTYLAVQALLIAVLASIERSDFGAVVLLFMLSAEAAASFSWRTSLAWVGTLVVITATLMFIRGGLEALIFLPIYGGGYFFFAAFADQTRQAEETRSESQRLLEELQDVHQQLREYAAQVEELAIAEERNRLAREMHDTLGHRLTVATVQLEGVERLIPTEPERAALMVGTVREQVRTGLGELRQIVAALRTPLELDLPLSKAITRLADDFERATGITVHRSLPPAMPTLSPALHLTLYRTAQEALTNVQRHAGAGQVWLTVLMGDDDTVTMQVHDDGRGWSPEANRSGLGLHGLRERAHQLGGELLLQAAAGGGAKISLRVPLSAEGDRG